MSKNVIRHHNCCPCKRDVCAARYVFLAWTRHVRARKTYLYMLIHFPCIDTEQMIFYDTLCLDYLVGWSYTTRDVDYTHISGQYTYKERSNIISPLYVFLAWTPSNTSFLHGRHADTSLLHGRPSDTSLLHGRPHVHARKTYLAAHTHLWCVITFLLTTPKLLVRLTWFFYTTCIWVPDMWCIL